MGHNVYLTGSAGTGKTYLINQYIEYLRVREVSVAVTASTGIAATHIGGQTIHSWSGIGIKDVIKKEDLDRIRKNKSTVRRLQEAKVLIIDEISMLSGKVLTGVSDILKHFKKSSQPFGGIQLILSGDFFQLPPVSREPLSNREKFAFMAPVWVESKLKVCYLTEQFRQKESLLSDVLNRIRSRDISQDILESLQDKLQENEEVDAIKLYTHNADVDSMNQQKLSENENKETHFSAETDGRGALIESLKQSVLATPDLSLKVGARVMFVRNNPERGYFNGTIGIIEKFDSSGGYPVVGTLDGRSILAKPEEWTITDEKENVLASYKQVPLRLAWAITVHKSQGMTLDEAEIDLSKTFEAGQGYVALSRLRNWHGLHLRGFNQVALAVDGLAFKADIRFSELSEENEDWVLDMEKEQLAISNLDFIDRCEGTNDPDVIEKNQKRNRKKKPEPKVNTFQKTKSLLQAGQSLEEVAFERELTQGTVISHLQRIVKDDPEFDLSPYAPKSHILKKVQKVMEKLEQEGNPEFYDSEEQLKLSVIHRALNGQMDYETLRLSRLFLPVKE